MPQPALPPTNDRITDYSIKYDRLWYYAWQDLNNRLEDPSTDLAEFKRFLDRWLAAQYAWRDYLPREAWKAWRTAQGKYLSLLRAKIYYKTLTWDDRSRQLRDLEREKRKLYQGLIAGIRDEIARARKELNAIGLPPKVKPPEEPEVVPPEKPPAPPEPEPAVITSTRVETIPPPSWSDTSPWGCRLIFRTDIPAWVRFRWRKTGLTAEGRPHRWFYHSAHEHNGTEYVFELMYVWYARGEFEWARAFSGTLEFQGTCWDNIARETTYGEIVTFAFGPR